MRIFNTGVAATCRLGLAIGLFAFAAMALAAPSMAQAEDGPFGLKLAGSFGADGFDRSRYVPPLTHFAINETPFITTELRPIYVHQNIPNGFVTQGGNVDAVALQGRLAITERLGFIATTDGYADIDFDATLPDTNGFLDITAGLKYAVHFDPAAGEIVTLGLRYTAPTGNIETANIDLTGRGKGFVNPFVSAAKTWERVQVQGAAGAQVALSDANWSYFHLNGHINFQVAERVFPFIEVNALLPYDGGNQFAKGTPVLSEVTGGDILDLGAPDPDDTVTLGGGLRFRLNDNMLVGAGAEANVLDDDNSVLDWRITADMVIHF